ncbi:MAG: cobalamin biosynthesis protein [Actinobacteria bacterium]|nr:cobalamin biosynthesis protein [Actinomycetota bacterium]
MAVSRRGAELALRLRSGFPLAEVFLPERFAEAGSHIHCWSPPLHDLIADLFDNHEGLVMFGSVGMTVRLMAPLMKDKHTDPAVVAVDDAGRFAVSVLSGHVGGANELASRVAATLGCQPVITTASDLLGTVAVDLLGRKFGWQMELEENVTRVSAALVNSERVALLQEAGEILASDLPENVVRVSSMEELRDFGAALIITDRLLPAQEGLPPVVLYRPRSLVVGVGCNRGTEAEEIVAAIRHAMEGHGLAMASIHSLASADIKANEPGLREAANTLDVPLEVFSSEELTEVDVPTPSALVQRWVSTPTVCEAAALLGGRAESLIVPKQKTTNVTVAVARRDFSGRPW